MNFKTKTMSQTGYLFEVNGFTAQLCVTPNDLEIAYALRQYAYVDSGAQFNPGTDLLKDEFDEHPSARTHLIWYEGNPVASVRGCIWSPKYDWKENMSVKDFGRSLDQHIGLEKNFLESSRYVTHPDLTGRKSLTAQLLMFRIHALGSLIDECDHLVTIVRPRHAPFYKRMMGFEPITEPILNDRVNFATILLAATRDVALKLAVERTMPMYTEEEAKRYESWAKLYAESF